jgi:DNA-binding XRE family transcriptional regulator
MMEAAMGEMISIPLDEYKALLAANEDLADLRAYDRTMAALAAGEEEMIPAQFVERMVNGESRLRVWRDFRGLTQAALGERAAVNRVQIADIEAGRKSGSVETLKKLARALGVDLDDIA